MTIQYELRVDGGVSQLPFNTLQEAQTVGLPHGEQGGQVLVTSFGDGIPCQFWYFDSVIDSWVNGCPEWA
jgi:hypothetical protein